MSGASGGVILPMRRYDVTTAAARTAAWSPNARPTERSERGSLPTLESSIDWNMRNPPVEALV
jgi:hypothetical protein